jgi:hypothetical protein
MYMLKKQCIYTPFLQVLSKILIKTKNAYSRCAPRVSIGIKHMATKAARIKTADM